ncbi:MAG: hypothetical protein U0Q16_16080 [Bryobacteraceae bacterium]
MTLSELEATLPNGLHDAYLSALSISFCEATAVLALSIHEGGEEEPIYREAEIQLFDVAALTIEGPAASNSKRSPICIDSIQTSDERYPGFSSLPLAVQRQFLSLYLLPPWNSFIHIAAAHAKLVWKEDASPG